MIVRSRRQFARMGRVVQNCVHRKHRGGDKQAFLARWEEMNRIVHDIVVEMRGSISAEHGIGQLKKIELEHYKASLELDLMRKVKAALDPQGLMNPGKVI